MTFFSIILFQFEHCHSFLLDRKLKMVIDHCIHVPQYLFQRGDGRDHMVVGFMNNCTISAHHY